MQSTVELTMLSAPDIDRLPLAARPRLPRRVREEAVAVPLQVYSSIRSHTVRRRLGGRSGARQQSPLTHDGHCGRYHRKLSISIAGAIGIARRNERNKAQQSCYPDISEHATTCVSPRHSALQKTGPKTPAANRHRR